MDHIFQTTCGHNRTRTGTTHRDRVALLPFNHTPIISGDDRTRTYNLSINGALLFAIELHPHISINFAT